jgi:hypothetical protein
MTKTPIVDWSNHVYMMLIEKLSPSANESGFNH